MGGTVRAAYRVRSSRRRTKISNCRDGMLAELFALPPKFGDTWKTLSNQREQGATLRRWAPLVNDVIATYTRIKQAAPIGAIQVDPEVPRGPAWSDNGVHFTVDVERIVDRVIQRHPNEKDALWKSWRRLLRSALRDKTPDVITSGDARLYELLGRVFERIKMHPRLYFRRIRHGSTKPPKVQHGLSMAVRAA